MRNKQKTHLLKIKPEYFREVMALRKKAEFRVNDRDYQVGDLIHFTDVEGCEYDGFNYNLFIITHKLDVREVTLEQSGKLEDYVMLSIEPYKECNDGKRCY